ncbi:MAG: DUF5011 domain-containing protein, partial [Verrucomicrobia bacterium]|nr:DUF5011 domain-containing protein [Verrucomicrobiota bacterium]
MKMGFKLATPFHFFTGIKVALCFLAVFEQTSLQATNFDPSLTFASRKLGTGVEGSNFINQFSRVGFGGGKYVAWSYWSSSDVFLSEDGVQWAQRSVSPQSGDNVMGCAFNGTEWLSVLREASSTLPVFSKSTDGGMNWQKVEGVSLPQEYIIPVDLAFVGGSWVLVGNSWPYDGGRVWTSLDGVNWVDRSAAGMPREQVVGYGNGALVVVGSGGKIYRSTDLGQSWTTPASGTTQRLRSVAYGNGRFVAVGEGGVLLTSTDDGATWVSQASGTTNYLTLVTFGNGVFVVSNDSGMGLMSSYDGIAWTSASGWGLGSANHRSLVYGVAGFVGLAYGNVIQSVSGSVPVWMPITNQLNATVGSPYSVSLATTGATSYLALNLPAGLTLNSATGQLSGTPTAAGTVAFYVYPVNAAGVGNYYTFTLTVRNPPENPLITLLGENPIVLWRMTSFTDPGAMVTDNRDAARTIYGTGTINTSVIGTYILTYNAVDADGYPAITRTRAVQVVAENTDLTPPQITEFTITPGSVDITGSSRTVTVTARITDDLSGLSWANLNFQSSGGGNYWVNFGSGNRISGTATNGVYQSQINIPRYGNTGTFTLSYCNLSDSSGRNRNYTTQEFADLGFPNSFAITGTSDQEGPRITEFSITPGSVDITGS